MAVCLDRYEIIASEAILDEVRRNLGGKFKLPASRVQQIIEFLREHSTLVEPASVPSKACRDASDRPILGTAVAGQVDFLVTGDQDLVSLGDYHKIPILTPRAFYDRLV